MKNQPDIVVVDDFLNNPDNWRELALQQDFKYHPQYHKGRRTEVRFWTEDWHETFETLLNRKITNANYDSNGIFQVCTAEDPLVYHYDLQQWAGALFLSPSAPAETGTSFFRSRLTNARLGEVDDRSFSGGFYDRTQFELIDTIGNVYNRLVLWNAKLIHSANAYNGTNLETGRLFQLFFFDAE